MPHPMITPAERLRTPERSRAAIVAIGSRARLSALLGYPSDNSLRQAEQGNTMLPHATLAWAERYAQFRREHYAEPYRQRAAAEAASEAYARARDAQMDWQGRTAEGSLVGGIP